MKKTLKFVTQLIALTVISLFAAQARAQVYDVDSRLERYVDEYIEIMELNEIPVPNQVRFMVRFHKESLPRNAAAAAWGMFKPFMVMVAVDPQAIWLSHNQLRWLMFHELTHDIFDVRHESGLELMKPVIPEYVSGHDVDKALCEVANYLKEK